MENEPVKKPWVSPQISLLDINETECEGGFGFDSVNESGNDS